MWAVLPKEKNASKEKLSKPELCSPEKAVVWEADPRTLEMGWRLVSDSQVDPLDIIGSCEKGDTEQYHRHRYAIGKPSYKVYSLFYKKNSVRSVDLYEHVPSIFF